MSGPLPSALVAALDEAARVDRLLVALDFDGTLAPFETDPERSRALPASVAALGRLVGLPGTTVALVSGRALEALAQLAEESGLPAERLALVGSHGLEVRWTDGTVQPVDLTAQESQALAEADARLTEIARAAEEKGVAGAWVGRKPVSVTLHTRPVEDRKQAGKLEARAIAAGESLPGVWVLPGKRVVELTVRRGDKGRAVVALAGRAHVAAVLYAGDDVTDEHAFAVLRPERGDVGIHVGPGRTAAQFRVDGLLDVADALTRLSAAREDAPA